MPKTPEEIAAEEAANKKPEDQKPTEPKEPEAPEEKKDEDKTAEELKAEAEAIEAEIKEKKGDSKEEEIRANQLRRLQKAREKRDSLNNEPEDNKKDEIAVEDLVTLEVKGIEKDSDEAKILQKYVKAGICSNYKEAMNHVGAKAELDALKESNDAKSIIDENDSEENQLKTKKEAVASYRQSGEVPEDPDIQKAIVEDNLKQMDL